MSGSKLKCIFLTVSLLIMFLAVDGFAQPSEFTLLGPTDGASDIEVWPLFTWETSTDPNGVTYTILIGENASFLPETYVEYSGLTATAFRPYVDLKIGEVYYWKVIAINGIGEETVGLTQDSFFDSYNLSTISAGTERTLWGYEPLEANRTIIAYNSPYYMRGGDYSVPLDRTLTLEAGVELLVDDTIIILVRGEFKSLGTEENPVLMHSTNPEPVSDLWGGVYFLAGAPSAQFDANDDYISGQILRHTHFDDSGYAAAYAIRTHVPIFVSSCLIADETNTGSLVFVTGNGGSVIADCEFRNILTTGNRGILNIESDDNILRNNTFVNCICETNSSWSNGGAAFVRGENNIVRDNVFEGCESTGSGTSSGGAISVGYGYFEITGNLFKDCIVHNNGYGGGVFAYDSSDGSLIRNNTFTGNQAKYGGGIFDDDDILRIESNTITANLATEYGGAIAGGRWILSNIIKYNQCDNSAKAGGIYTTADSVCFNNLNNNDNYDLVVSGSQDVIATQNWWFTRSDQGMIAGLVFDKVDNTSLGYAIYSPIAGEPSTTAPRPFTEVLSIEAKDDSTYETYLSHVPCPGDTLFFTITGVDSNPYNRDVTVAEVVNFSHPDWVDPYFEETGFNTGVFNGFFLLSDETALPNRLAVQHGDQVSIFAEVDHDFFFEIEVCGGDIPPVAAFTASTQVAIVGELVNFTNESTGTISSYTWDFGDGSSADVPTPSHTYSQPGLYDIELLVSGPLGDSTANAAITVLGDAPVLRSVTDLSEDQGGWVMLEFYRSFYDDTPLKAEIYSVERFDTAGWTAVASSAAYAETVYRVQVPTLTDSLETSFRVIASLDAGTFVSNTVAGMSADNLFPGVPEDLAWLASDQLGWAESNAPDLKFFTIYGSSSDQFVSAESIGFSSEPQFLLSSVDHEFYFVTATDFSGNESGPAMIKMQTVSVIVGRNFEFRGNYPNPFNPRTTISFSLAAADEVLLRIYDISGRLVNTLLPGSVLAAGNHDVEWNGVDSTGKDVATGVYFSRLTVGEKKIVGRMTLIR